MKKVLLFGALALSLNGFAQKVTGKIVLQKGQKYEVVSDTKSNVTQELMGQSMESSSHSTMTEIYDVQEAGKNGSAIEHKVKRFQVTGEGGMGGQSMSFDSEKPEDLKNEMGQLVDKKVLKNKYTVMINGAGLVTGVKADDDNPNGKKDDAEAGMAAMMLQQLGAISELPKAGDKTLFAVLPEREVMVGDSWNDSTKKDGIVNHRTYKLASITNDAIIVDVTSETKVNKTMEIMGQSATIVTSEKGLGSITLDRKTGVVRSITNTSKNEGNVEVQGMSIPITATSNSTVTVTAK
jgi:hypothetical protein